jgi:mannose-6-phosphate isomerase-like protein (cupin superfamily)
MTPDEAWAVLILNAQAEKETNGKETEVETNDPGAIQVPRGKGRMLWLMGDLIELKMVGEDTGGSYALIESNPPPGFPGPPPHIHHREDEAFYVLEGEIELNVEGNVSRVKPGTFVHVPRGTLHTFSNPGETPARFLALISPAGFERWFEDFGEPATDLSSAPQGAPDVERILATAHEYGLEFPPPPGE